MPTSKRPFKTVRVRPLTGPMNPVATADELAYGHFAWKENLEINKNNRLTRRGGFDQFLEAGRPGVKYLDEVTTTDGVRRMISADSDGTVNILSSSSNTWSDLGGTFSDNDSWDSDSLGNTVVLTDGVGSVHYADLPGDAQVLAGLESLSVTAAQVVIQFSGCLFVMNMKEGGFPYPSRIRWSGLNAPLEWESGEGTIAGFQDLPYNQKILGASVIGDRLLIYTDVAIWACRATGTDAVFGFTQLYTDPVNRSKCLAHKKSLVAVGSTNVYVGLDGVYTFNSYQREPLRLDWMDAAARIMFEPDSRYVLSRYTCDVVAGYNPDKQEIWLSWAGESGNHTIIANTLHKTCDYDGRGWHAFSNHSRSNQQTFGEWLDLYVPNDAVDWFTITNVNYNTLCNTQLSDICIGCDDNPVFLGALKYQTGPSGTVGDGELKVIANNVDGVRIKGHDLDGSVEGFYSVLRGVVPVGEEDHDKIIRRFMVDVTTDANSTNNARIKLRTGVSQQAYVPNDLGSSHHGIQWSSHPARVVGPDPSGKSLDTLDSESKLRTLPLEWNLHERGRFLYWELTVEGADGLPTVLLDMLEFSRIEMEVRMVPRT